MIFTPEQEAIIEDTYLSLTNDRGMYLWGKNFFTQERLSYGKSKLSNVFGSETFSFRRELGSKYIRSNVEEMTEIMERFYYHLFGIDLYPKEPSQEELNEFVAPTSNNIEKLAKAYGASSFTINKIKEREMSIEAKNVNVPVATVTLVYGKDIKGMDESQLVSFHSEIEAKKKAFAELDQKSAYYKVKITSIEEAKKMVAAELDSRI